MPFVSLAGQSNLAVLDRADFSKAILDKANLEGVDLRRAQGLTKRQLDKAQTDLHTLFPTDLPP